MGRLRSLSPQVGSLTPRLARQTDDHGHSRQAEPLRPLYSTIRWRRLRLDVFERDLYTCQCGCGVVEPDTSKLTCDHRKPHRGDLALFWDPENLQTLRSVPCHVKWKQRREAADRGRGG